MRENQLRLLLQACQIFFRSLVFSSDRKRSALDVMFQIAKRTGTGFHCCHFSKALGQWNSEEPNPGIKIGGCFSLGSSNGALHQPVDQKAVHLKERIAADAESIVFQR